MTPPRASARHHGDQAAAPGMLDFAVDVRAAGPPSWLLRRRTARLEDLGRHPDEVLPQAGGADWPTLVEAMREVTR